MDKKSVLALIIIGVIIVLMGPYQEWLTGDSGTLPKQDSLVAEQAVAPKKEIIPAAPQTTEIPITDDSSEKMASDTIDNKIAEIDKLYQTRIISENADIIIDNLGGGRLVQYDLLKYAKYDSSLVNIICEKNNNGLFFQFMDTKGNRINTGNFKFNVNKVVEQKVLKSGETFEIEYELQIANSLIRKKYRFYGDAYHFDVFIQFENAKELLMNDRYILGWKNGMPATESYEEDDNIYNQVNFYMGEELGSFDHTDEGLSKTERHSGTADWISNRTKYFLTAISPISARVDEGIYFSGRGEKHNAYIKKYYDFGYNVSYSDNSQGDQHRVYIGPLDHQELGKYDNDLDQLIMNNGWYESLFRFFSLIILRVLEFMHRFIPNYGVVIIIFSVLIKLLLYPLTKKSYSSMKEMQVVQPLMTEIREKYKKDPQRMNKEMMKLYKEHGVNPMGGCLPMLLQMPLLMALFIVFRSTIQLRGASFIPGWIDDLSRAESLLTLPFSIPFYGNEFNLLPLLMAVTMIYSSKMTMQDPKQKAMVYMMPIMMLFFFNKFPSGLNLYYTLFNLLTIIQQKFINKGKSAEPQTVAVKTGKKKRQKK
jgi:YidC/Oxa1 family membrane protein insertase